MSALAKIKKQAAQLEHDRQYDKALALYARLLDGADGGVDAADDEIDVALYNRAGDVALRSGDAARAVGYYERALDKYATGGFLNNAIALGAKILRQAPERVATHYTLGVLYAKKGFRSDARQHFLAYAERMHRGGQPNEVARSLADYVVLCDGAADARAGLAAHLAIGAARPGDVATRLAELLEQALQAAGQLEDGVGAPGAAGAAHTLVFLDLDPSTLGAEDASGAEVHPAAMADASTTWDAPTEEPFELLDAGVFGSASDRSFEEAFLDLGPTSEPTVWSAEPTPSIPPIDRLRSLPGELPPLSPSLVALDGGGSTADWSVAPASPLGTPQDPGAGPLTGAVPAFAIDSAGRYPDVLLEMPSGIALFADDPDEGPVAPALVELPLLDDDPLDGPRASPVGLEPASAWQAPLDVDPASAPDEGLLDLDAFEATSAPVAIEMPLPEPARRATPASAPTAVVTPTADDGLDLGAWLRASEPAPSTRLVAAAMPTTGDEQADFQATLQAFKAGIARSLTDADFDAHYDLGVAYKEMGLLEEAVGEFQKAARAPDRPLRALEALAECFLEREEPQLVLSTLGGVAAQLGVGTAPGTDASQHVALCYLLGAASQEVGRTEEARGWFVRVLATDYAFRDAATRLASLSPPTR
jgi:tetratricopeptide (TPR) repeat protein